MSFQNKKILVIDDTASIRTFLRISLQSQSAIYFESSTANQGVKQCHNIHPDLIVLDLGLPDRNGIEIITKLKRSNHSSTSPIVIVLSVTKDQYMKDKSYKLGADAYLTKPFLVEDLLKLMNSTLKITN